MSEFYKNGREAKVGDRVIHPKYGLAGIVRFIVKQSNGVHLHIFPEPVFKDGCCVKSSDCLHADDVKKLEFK